MFTVLIGALCAITVLAVASIMHLWPPAVSKPAVTVEVDVGVPISSLTKGQAVRFTAPAGKAFEMTDGGGLNIAGNPAQVGWLVYADNGLVALAANSSDDGCNVTLDPAGEVFMDPCHGAEYALDGHVRHGPAQAPLAHLSWRKVGVTTIAVRSTKAA